MVLDDSSWIDTLIRKTLINSMLLLSGLTLSLKQMFIPHLEREMAHNLLQSRT